jgi:nucleoside phosphorylase
MSLVIATGMAVEARIAGAGNFATIVGAGQAGRLAADLEAAVAGKAACILSFGFAGGLAPQLRAGDLVVPHGLCDGEIRLPCDPAWRAGMRRRLQGATSAQPQDGRSLSSPGDEAVFRMSGDGGWRAAHGASGQFETVDILGANAPVADAEEKAALFASSGAAAVDMESAIVARIAQRQRIPFAILRVILDPADRSLPSVALKALGPEGTIDFAGLLVGLLARPGQIFPLLRLAQDARRALLALRQASAVLGVDFAILG